MSKCEHCGDEYNKRQHSQRFCGSVCANSWHMDERRRAIELLRDKTYFGRALAEAAESGGRYAAVGPVSFDGPLPAAAWARDPAGQEPPIVGDGPTVGDALGGAGGAANGAR